ncbi:MAG: ABC transporter permease [Candidatus Micrarchaeota archaeon]
MNELEMLNYALEGLRYRKLRSWLTIFGVVIGIASIVTLIALAQGLDVAVKDQITAFGTNFIQIVPGKPFSSSSFGPPVFKGALYEKDTDSIRRVQGIDGISSIVSPGYGTFAYKNSSFTSILTGLEPEAFNAYVKNTGMESGAFLKSTDKSGIVIGNAVAKKAFKEEVEVGKTIYVNDVPFRVKGIINPAAAFDQDIYIVKQSARQFIAETEDPNRIFAIFIITEEGRDVKPIADQVERIIARNHRVPLDDTDFSLLTADSILESIGVIFGLLSIFLGMVAGISLLVGSIGIANSMYTSVLERTQEIGILKAVGAKQSVIVRIFLTEAALIGLVGGLGGIILGYLVSALFNYLGAPTQVSIELIALGILLSVIVGIISGYYPARKASRLQPVEALRYE